MDSHLPSQQQAGHEIPGLHPQNNPLQQEQQTNNTPNVEVLVQLQSQRTDLADANDAANDAANPITLATKLHYHQSRAFHSLSKACGNYAVWCIKYGYILLVLSILITITIGIGLIHFSSETNMADLWAERNSELESNRKFYNEHFGGLERSTSLVISAKVTDDDKRNVEATHDPWKVGKNALTKTHLRAMHHVSAQLLSSDLHNATPRVQVLMQVNSTANAFQNLFSVRTPVPNVFKPGVTQPAVDLNFFSYGYQALTACLAASNALFDPSDRNSLNPRSIEPLEEKWGISQYPTFRNTPLDCFQEGNFDYPTELIELDRVARSVYFAREGMYAQAAVNTTAIFQECSQQLSDYFYELFLSQNFRVSGAREYGNEITKTITQIHVAQFATWGYSWRRSFESFITDVELIDYIEKALRNSKNESLRSLECMLGKPCCVMWNGLAVDYEMFLGDIRYDSEGRLKSISYLRSSFLGSNKDESRLSLRLSSLFGLQSSEERAAFVRNWEQTVINFYTPMYERKPNSGFAEREVFASSTLNFYTEKSAEDVTQQGNEFPATLALVSCIILVVYSCITFMHYSYPFGWKNFVYSRLILGILGILSVGAATLCGFGLLSWAKITISPIGMNLAPFLGLGLGLNTMFVILHELVRYDAYQYNVEERMRKAVETGGPTVILSSLANIASFFVASSINVAALRVFCWQVGITMTFNIIFLFSIFIPLCCWDCKRVASKRLDFAPWIKKQDIMDECDANAAGVFSFGVFMSEMLGGKILLRNWFCKAAVILAFISLFIPMTVMGFTKTLTGLAFSEVALTGSYQASYAGIRDVYFTGYRAFLVSKNVSYDEIEVQQAMLDQQTSLQNAEHTSAQPAIRQRSWLATSGTSLLYNYNSPRHKNTTTPIPTTDYYPFFFEWMQMAGTSFLNDLWCYDTSSSPRIRIPCVQYSLDTFRTKMGATRQWFIQSGLQETDDFVHAITSARQAVKDYNIHGNDAFVYGHIYEFWEQYVNVWSTLYSIVGFCILSVFVISLCVTFSLLGSIILVGNIFIVVLTLFGLMALVGIRLNAVSIINYAIAVGVSMEYSTHIFMAFRASRSKPNDNRDERAIAALSEVLLPTLRSMLCTVLALLPILGSEFAFIRKYYFGMLFTMTILAFLNGMFLLPVIVSIIGPEQLYLDESTAENDGQQV